MSTIPNRAYQFEEWVREGLGVSIQGLGLKLNSEEDASDLVEKIKASKNMKYLELEGNSLGVEAAKAIGRVLEGKPELEAALWKDLFTGRLKDEIPKAMAYLFNGVDFANARLTRLDLSDNAIGPVGMVGLAPFFKSPCSFSLKELICNNNGLGPEGGSMFAQALSNCYDLSVKAGGEIFQLKVFVCGRNRMENKAGTAISAFFEKVKSLEEVHMPQNGIYTPGMNAISKALRNNENLRVINFNDNTIRPDGSVELAETISGLQNLEEVNLGDCLLKSKGTTNIVNALKGLRNIQILNFESNEICKPAGLEIASILRTIPSLVNVNLGCNEFGEDAVQSMCDMMCEVQELLIDEDLGEREEGDEEDEEEETEENEEDDDYEDVDDEDVYEVEDEEGAYYEEEKHIEIKSPTMPQEKQPEYRSPMFKSSQFPQQQQQQQPPPLFKLPNSNQPLGTTSPAQSQPSIFQTTPLFNPSPNMFQLPNSAAVGSPQTNIFGGTPASTDSPGSGQSLFSMKPSTFSFSFKTPQPSGDGLANIFGNTLSFSPPKKDPVDEFLKTPNNITFGQLTPDPLTSLKDHASKSCNEENTYSEIVLQEAMKVATLIPELGDRENCHFYKTFHSLLLEAYEKGDSKIFGSHLLVALGVLKSEHKAKRAAKPSDRVILALARFVEDANLPQDLVSIVSTMLNANTLHNLDLKSPSMQKLLGALDAQLVKAN